MFFRKTRTHFQGASNRSNDRLSYSNNNLTIYKSSTNLQNIVKVENKNTFTSTLKKRSKRYNNINNSQSAYKQSLSFQENEPESGVEIKLRKIFKNSKDIVKLLNHWGFDQKGFISREQLHQVINRKMGCEV